MNWYAALQEILTHLPPDIQAKLLGFWHHAKSAMDSLDVLIVNITPGTEFDAAAVALVNQSIANLLFHNAMKACKDAQYYKREAFDLGLIVVRALCKTGPTWFPTKWHEQYDALPA